MARERNLKTAIISALIGCLLGTIACLIFFWVLSPAPSPAAINDAPPSTPATTGTPAISPNHEIPNPEIKAADVTSVSINTVYKGFFETGNKCSKTYNEYFGNDDGFGSSSSPCTVKITFTRDGKATRSVEISRWDKAAKERRVVEKSNAAAEITNEQFDTITRTIVANEAFKSWKNGTMINVSNCTITVTHAGGTKSPMSNVDENTTVYLEMVEAFKQLEKQLSWKTE